MMERQQPGAIQRQSNQPLSSQAPRRVLEFHRVWYRKLLSVSVIKSDRVGFLPWDGSLQMLAGSHSKQHVANAGLVSEFCKVLEKSETQCIYRTRRRKPFWHLSNLLKTQVKPKLTPRLILVFDFDFVFDFVFDFDFDLAFAFKKNAFEKTSLKKTPQEKFRKIPSWTFSSQGRTNLPRMQTASGEGFTKPMQKPRIEASWAY